jgi:hypothetical protein
MVGLIDDELSESWHKFWQVLLASLHHPNGQWPDIEFSRTHNPGFDSKELHSPVPPLLGQLLGVNQNETRLLPGRNYGQSTHGFSCPTTCLQNSEVTP